MRTLSILSLAVCLALFGACGGAGTDAVGAATQTADVTGKVTDVDGSNADLAGIVVESRGDGTRVITGPDGSFRLQVKSGEAIVLRFENPDNPASGEGRPDAPEGNDTTPDGSDIDGNEVEIEPLDEDESCEIEVELENGEVVECRVDRPERDGEKEGEGNGEERRRIEAECKLRPADGSSEPEAVAEAEIVCEADCCVLEVEVGDVLFAETLTVAVECEEAVAEIGTIAIVEGGGHFEIDSCQVEVLPFDVASIYDLRSCTLLLLDEAGAVALSGCVPGERAEEEREREEGNEKDEESESEEGSEKDEESESEEESEGSGEGSEAAR